MSNILFLIVFFLDQVQTYAGNVIKHGEQSNYKKTKVTRTESYQSLKSALNSQQIEKTRIYKEY